MTRAFIELPTLPNFVTIKVGKDSEVKVSIANIDDEDIEEMGRRWVVAMKAHAKKKREVAP